MSRHVLWASLAAAALLAIGSEGQAQTTRPDPENKAVVRVVNQRWDSVRVEMRIGPSATCEQNDLAGVATLRRGKYWTVRSDNQVCFRMDSTFSAGRSSWTNWTRRVGSKLTPVVDTLAAR